MKNDVERKTEIERIEKHKAELSNIGTQYISQIGFYQ